MSKIVIENRFNGHTETVTREEWEDMKSTTFGNRFRVIEEAESRQVDTPPEAVSETDRTKEAVIDGHYDDVLKSDLIDLVDAEGYDVDTSQTKKEIYAQLRDILT